MKLRLPVRLKLAVLAGLRSVVQATLASGFLAVGAVFFSFSAQAEDDPVALEVAEDEDEAAVPVDDEAPASGLGVSAAELNDSQAAALAEAEQEHAAELGINATSSAVSQAAIEAQDAAVSPAQAAGGSHADSFAAVPAADSPALTLPAAEGAVAPSLCAEGAADFATDYAPIKTASVAVLPQASTSLTLPEDVVMASSPVAEAAQTSSSSTSVAVSSSSSSGGAVACGGGAACGGGGSSASFSASVPVTDVSSSGSDLPSDSVVSAEDPALSPSEPSPSLPDDSELVDSSPSSDSSSLSDAASLSSSLSASASTTGASSSSPAARSFSLKLLGSTSVASETESTGTSESASSSSTVAPTVFQFEGNTASRSDDGYHSATGVSVSGRISYENSNQGISSAYGKYYLARDLGQAVNLTNGYIKLADGYWKNDGDCELSKTSSFTITTFVKFNSISTSTTGTDEQTIFSTGGGNDKGFAFGVKEGKFDFLRKGKAHDVAGGIAVKAGEWYNLTISYNGSTANFYLNGESFATLNITGDYVLTSDAKAAIGSSTFDTENNRLKGLMADLRIYSGAPSEEKDQNLRNAAGLGILWQGAEGSNVWDTTTQNQNWKTREGPVSFTSNESVVFAGGDNIATTVVLGEGTTQAYVVGITGAAFTFSKGEVETRTLQVQELNIASGASLTTESGITLSGSDLNLAGTLNSVGSTTFTGLANVSGSVNVTGGSLTLSGTNNFTDGATLSKGESGEMNLSGTNHVSGTLTITSGIVDFSGATTLSSGTTLSVNDGAQLLLSGTTDVSGTLTVSQGSVQLTGTNTLSSGTTLSVNDEAQLRLSGTTDVSGTLTVTQGSVQLTGTNTLAAGTTFSLSNTSQVSLSGTTVIAGDLTVSGGALELGGTITNNGSRANLKVGDGGSYSVVVSEENKLTYDGFEIWKEVNSGADDSAAVLRRSNAGQISLYDSAVTYANVSLNKIASDQKDINATLDNVDFTNTGSHLTDIKGTATFSSLTNEGTNLKVSGTATINGQLSTGSTITNTGTINFGENATVELTSLDALVGRFYDSDPSTLTNSGYLLERVLISGGTSRYQGTGGSLSATYDGESYTLIFGDGYVSLTGSGQSDTYYINSGDSLEYGAATNSLASDTTKTIVLNGGTLEITSDHPLNKTTQMQMNSASSINLGKGTKLAASAITRNGNTLTLEGSGVYDMGSLSDGSRTKAANGIELGDSWTGTITVSSSENWSTGGISLNEYVRIDQGASVASSYVELKEVTSWINPGNATKANIILTNTGDKPALTICDGHSSKECKFYGSVSGEGDIKVAPTSGVDKMTYSFLGDVEEWTGKFILDKSEKTHTVKFAENATKVNAALTCKNGTLNVVASAGGGTTFANKLTVSSLTATTALTLNAKVGEEDTTEDNITGALDASGQSVTVGEKVTLTVGGLTTARHFENAGTVTLKGGASISETLVNKGSLTVGTGSNSPHLTIGAPIINSGNMTVNAGTVLTLVGDEAELICSSSGAEFNDTAAGTSGASSNGFITKGNFYLILNQNGTLTMSDSVVKSIIVNGVAVSATIDNSGVHYAASQSEIASLDSTYFVNTGNVVYGASDNSADNPKVTELCLTGGTLELASRNLDSGVSLLVTGDSTVAIGEGRTLSEEVLTLSRGSLTLTGSGTYRMAAADFGATAALTEGVVPGADASFTGTVWLSSGTTLAGTNLSGLTSGASSVTLNGVSGYLNNGTISTNLVLTNNGAVPALAINNGTNGDTRTFSGSISGTGTMARTNRMEGNNTVESGETQNFKFTGNIEGWTGVFDNQVSKTTNLTFGGEATAVNATLKHTAKGGVLNISTENNTTVTFSGGMSVTSLTAGANSTIILNGNSKVIGGVEDSSAVSGSFVVGNGGSLTVGGLTVGGDASLTNLTVSGGGSVTLKGAATATGAVTVESGGYLALGTGGLTLSGEKASLTLEKDAIVALQGWTATTTETINYLESKVYTTGYSGGKLFSLAADFTGSAPTFTNVNFTVVKDGASFTNDPSLPVKRVTVNTNDGTVTITTAAFYNVASNDEKTIAEATKDTVDYINVLGTLTGVNNDNIGSLGVGATGGVQGSGTLKLDGELTDGYHLSSFTGSIAIGDGSTFVTDGNVDRAIKLGGRTGDAEAEAKSEALLKVTENATLSMVTISSGETGAIEVAEGKSLIVNSVLDTSAAKGNLIKEGAGTLSLAASVADGPKRNVLWGNLTINDGEVILYSAATHSGYDQSNAVVRGNIVINEGGTLTANGIDPLGYAGTWPEAGSPNCTKKLTMAGSENAYAVLNIASGQHVTLSTAIYMNGYSQINGRYLNAWSSFKETTDSGNSSEKNTAYIYAESKGNVINADFYLRHHALFEVGTDGELSLNGNILKLDDAAYAKPIFRKAGAGTLILDSPTATTLYNLSIEEGEVRISTDLSFAAASALADFSLHERAKFTVSDDGRFTYGGWTYEMKDGSSAKATVTAGADTTGALLSQGGITIANTKLTNTADNTNTDTNTLTISAKLDNVAFTQDNSGSVTIADAAGTGTQHLSSLAVNAGSVTLNNAQLDAAKVASGATLNFTKGTTITLGSTIQNAGTVALIGTEGGVSFTIDLNNLSGFDVYGTAGYSDARYSGSSDQDARVGYNGFYKGQTYYLVKNAGGNVDLSGATITDAVVMQSETGESYYFETTDKDTKYYINNSSQQDTNYKYSADAENSMYGGYLGAEDADHFATSGIVMDAENGRLILATNLQESVSDGIIMNKAGSITVESGVTLKQSSLSLKSTAEATLKGAGIYKVGSTALLDIAKGFTDPDWKGTVQVSGAATGMKLSYMGHAGSTVQMTGVYGTLEDTVTDAKTYAMDIALVNGESSAPALEFTANNGSDITFSGAMSGAATNAASGEGSTMKVSGATAQTVQNITFTGDMSGWNGAFEAGKGTVNLTLTGDATVVNAGIHKSGTSDILNISIDGSATRTFNKVVSGDNLMVTAGNESTRIILTEGGNVTTSAVLTENNAILEVRDAAFIVWNGAASFAANGSSGIDIADKSGVVTTTIRTYAPTVASAQTEEDAGAAPLNSVCGTITNGAFRYDAEKNRAIIASNGQSTGRIENTIIDLAEGTTLELSNMVLADTVKITDASAKMISTNNVVELGSNNAKVNTTAGRDLGGVTLQKTGSAASAEGALPNVSGKVYTIDFTGIQNVEITSGTLTFDFNAYSDTVNGRTLTGFELFYELGKTYDYIAVNFAADSADSSKATIQYANLKVQSQITNGQGATATSTGYYNVNATATSGVVVYFDALALPEPTTSTLALLALTALCARRRRPQTTR